MFNCKIFRIESGMALKRWSEKKGAKKKRGRPSPCLVLAYNQAEYLKPKYLHHRISIIPSKVIYSFSNLSFMLNLSFYVEFIINFIIQHWKLIILVLKLIMQHQSLKSFHQLEQKHEAQTHWGWTLWMNQARLGGHISTRQIQLNEK